MGALEEKLEKLLANVQGASAIRTAGGNIPVAKLRDIMREVCPCIAALEEASRDLHGGTANKSIDDLARYMRALDFCEGTKEALCEAKILDAVTAFLGQTATERQND